MRKFTYAKEVFYLIESVFFSGYLACSYLLHKTDPLSVLLVNTILRDMSNKNVIIVALALSASCCCIQPEDLPILLPLVDEKLKHSSVSIILL